MIYDKLPVLMTQFMTGRGTTYIVCNTYMHTDSNARPTDGMEKA